MSYSTRKERQKPMVKNGLLSLAILLSTSHAGDVFGVEEVREVEILVRGMT